MERSYEAYYDLEHYLFTEVQRQFHTDRFLDAQSFFMIIIWKANRAKSLIAKRILKLGYTSLDEAAKTITTAVYEQPQPKEKLRYLMEEAGFRLPMATAILTVLYADTFTVYDVRVCDVLSTYKSFHHLAERKFSQKLWEEYEQYIQYVIEMTPSHLSLRDKDRYLWGQSFYEQLEGDIARNFQK